MWQKIILGLLILVVLAVVMRHLKANKVIDYYAKQGITVFPGARTFFLGNTSLVGKWEELRLAS